MKKYDVGFMFMCCNLNTGCFYDTFEYYHLFKELGHNCCLIMINSPETKEQMISSILDRYDVTLHEEDLHYFDFHHTYDEYREKMFPILCRTIFVLGVSGFENIITSRMLIGFNTMFVMYDKPFDSLSDDFYQNQNKYKNVKILYDSRIMNKMNGFECTPYTKKINFSIFKKLNQPSERVCVSLYCDHKCYTVQVMKDIIARFPKERFFLYTKNDGDYNIEYYIDLESERVLVETAPVKNFMERFNKLLYLPSLRGFDPSPRLIAECKYYNKDIIVYDENKISDRKDGSFFRLKENPKDLELNSKDEIIKIYEKNS